METLIAEDAKMKENTTMTHAIYALYAASLLVGGITALSSIASRKGGSGCTKANRCIPR